MRRYIFIEGSDEATSWWPHLIKFGSRLSISNPQFLSMDELYTRKVLRKAREAVIFINGHGSSCKVGNDFSRSTKNLASYLTEKFPSESCYIHFGSCSSLSPSCSSLDSNLRLIPGLRAISGFTNDIDSKEAAKLEYKLLSRIIPLDSLNFNDLKALKYSLFYEDYGLVEQLGFKLFLN